MECLINFDLFPPKSANLPPPTLRDYIEDFEEEYLDGVSHWVMTEAPQAVNKAIERYLKQRA